MSGEKDVAETFNRLAERYDLWYDRNAHLFEREATIIPPPSAPSLEVGCGSGRFMEKLGINVGIDISERLLSIARRRGLQVMLADGKDMPFRDGFFSSAYLIFTLCFLERPEDILLEVGRVLKSSGRLYVCVVPRDSGLGREYASKESPFYRIARFYSESEVENMLSKSGFEIEGARKTMLTHSDNDFVCFAARKC